MSEVRDDFLCGFLFQRQTKALGAGDYAILVHANLMELYQPACRFSQNRGSKTNASAASRCQDVLFRD